MKTLADVFDEGAVLEARVAYTKALEAAGFPEKLTTALVYNGWYNNKEALETVIEENDNER